MTTITKQNSINNQKENTTMNTITKSNSVNNQKENKTMSYELDQQLLSYYEQGKKRFMPPKNKKK